MRLLNSKNPKDVAKIFPWFITTESQGRMDIATELYYRLKENPQSTLLLVAIERNITRGVLIAHVSDKRKKHIWLWQCRFEPGFRHSRTMLEALKSWARGRGAKEIRMGPNGHKKAYQRRWGFELMRNGDMKLKIA